MKAAFLFHYLVNSHESGINKQVSISASGRGGI